MALRETGGNPGPWEDEERSQRGKWVLKCRFGLARVMGKWLSRPRGELTGPYNEATVGEELCLVSRSFM